MPAEQKLFKRLYEHPQKGNINHPSVSTAGSGRISNCSLYDKENCIAYGMVGQGRCPLLYQVPGQNGACT